MLALDSEKLLSLFEDFYILTSFHICLFDEKQTAVLRYPTKHSPFCGLVRSSAQIDAMCQSCDAYAFTKCREKKVRYSYTCHMNLTETATPLLFDGEIIGYIMMGQVRSARSNFDSIPENTKLLISDIKSAKKLFSQIPTASDLTIKAAAHILDACASYLYVSRLVTLQREELFDKIDNYIAEHITENITVDDFCRELHTSRVELYDIFHRLFKTSPAQYLKETRLKHAKKLLTTTKMPVSKIAQNCGFSDYNYFSKVFKKQFGISATMYRKNN